MLHKTKHILTTVIFLFVLNAFSQGTAVTVDSYPSNLATGIPISISSGVGCTTVNVVSGIEIKDRSLNGWTLFITSANGTSTQPRLQHEINNTTIDYNLEANYNSGTLAAGLTLVPPYNTTLVFNANTALITTTGTTTQRTNKLNFDLRMTIADAATVGKLAGNYTDQLTLVLASND
ncbi:MAG: hypothetical protein JXR69_10800 [Candidatus Delongbacteria bacterium]|nr:hypothetical protein [Candidatus Delongbacteria bacterium]